MLAINNASYPTFAARKKPTANIDKKRLKIIELNNRIGIYEKNINEWHKLLTALALNDGSAEEKAELIRQYKNMIALAEVDIAAVKTILSQLN